jgi:hypothetical protein
MFNKQLHCLPVMLHDSVITATAIDGYMQQFTWPRRLEGKRVTGKSAFAPKRAKSNHEAKSFSASISEMLSTYAVFGNFLHRVVVPELERAQDGLSLSACTCYFALCTVLDLLIQSDDDRVTPGLLDRAIMDHATLFTAVHGEDAAPPKFHFALHMGSFLRKFGVLPNCVVHERKHKVIKRYLQD